MPRLKQKLPSYRRHRASSQAVITPAGRDYYLGTFDSPESRTEYDRLIQEFLANSRCPGEAGIAHDSWGCPGKLPFTPTSRSDGINYLRVGCHRVFPKFSGSPR